MARHALRLRPYITIIRYPDTSHVGARAHAWRVCGERHALSALPSLYLLYCTYLGLSSSTLNSSGGVLSSPCTQLQNRLRVNVLDLHTYISYSSY